MSYQIYITVRTRTYPGKLTGTPNYPTREAAEEYAKGLKPGIWEIIEVDEPPKSGTQ